MRPAAQVLGQPAIDLKVRTRSNMPTAIPPEIEKLASIAAPLATLKGIGEMMQYHSCFQAAHSVLTQESDNSRKQKYLTYIERLLPRAGNGRVMFLSFLVAATQEAKHLWDLHRTLSKPDFTVEQRHFFYWQLITRHSTVHGLPTVDPAAVYFSLLESYRKALRVTPLWIEAKDRDAGTIVVMTNQLLGLRHAPTADCLDYCHVLQNRLKKRVILINTGDMPWTLPLPYYDPILFEHAHEYSSGGKLPFRGEVFDFYQCRKPMPNLEEIESILNTILALRPSFILSLGHSNVTPDLCSEVLTVATMPFGTDLPRAASNIFILPRKRRSDDAGFMQKWHITEEQIVETLYTFRLPERSATLTRAELGLPPDAYVIAVVGNRLDEEINDKFAAGLADFLQAVPQAFVAFMGTFRRYDPLIQHSPVLGKRSVFLGHQKDISAVYECCDAYLNPPRYGGGSSAAFALAAGLPVFTRNSGDVVNIVGARFVFESFREIQAFVEQTLTDLDHRRQWARMSKSRFDEISDREGMLGQIVQRVTAKADIRNSRHP